MSSPGSSITRNSSSEKHDQKEVREGEAGRAGDLNELERGFGGGSSAGGGSMRKGISSKDEKEEEKAVNEKGEVVPKLVYVPFIGRRTPREPYESIATAPIIPFASANLFSIWTFWWIQPLLILGYQRTLGPKDLWKLSPELESGFLADKLMGNFERRREIVESFNAKLKDGSYVPTTGRKVWWKVKSKVFGIGKGDGVRSIGLAGAISDTFFYQFWSGGAIKVLGDLSQILSPLVTKALIDFSTQSYYGSQKYPGFVIPPVGKGIGLAFGLWFMQILYSVCTNQFFVRSASTGVLVRGALIASIYRRSMRLSGKARTVITNGKLVNHISTDVSRVDFCCSFFHMSWTAPIQLISIIAILLFNLGPSSLAGIGFLFVCLPFQAMAMKSMFAFRRKAMVWTDKRAKLIQELLGGMRVIKFFAWEIPYLEKLAFIRKTEMTHIRKLLTLRAGNTAVALSIPMLATVIAFLLYAGTGHSQDPAIIFTSLTLFNLLRMPLMMLPMSLSTITDAYNALGRLTEVFLAEERSGSYELDRNSPYAIEVTDADFQWEGTPPETAPLAKGSKADKKKEAMAVAAKLKAAKKEKKAAAATLLKDEKAPPTADGENLVGDAVNAIGVEDPTVTPVVEEEAIETLQLSNINLKIPRGQLCAIVGPVGSGKSSLLQALVGEMKRNRGQVIFGGSIAYAAQQAWIQNCTLKDNILFGQEYDEARYEQVIRDSCLTADLEMLPNGDLTEIGEKGITLSGGQKQRVNIARALYYNADCVLLDDPLSAVDAHVGKHLFDHAICGSLRDKTRVLVTHALHFLPSVDYIICLEKGQITQQGTYAELIADHDGVFSKLVREFGGGEAAKEEVKEEVEVDTIELNGDEKKVPEVKRAAALMQEEERATGAVSASIYGKFFQAANGKVTGPLLALALIMSQAAQVIGSYWLVWWQEDAFNKPQGFYMGLYAMLGLAQAFFSFLMGLCGVYLGYNASRSLHHGAIHGVMRAPMSFFDTSPLGRIMNRFSKDVDTVDNVLNDSMRMAFATASSVLGAIILIGIVEHYFLPVVIVVLGFYWLAAQFYRASAREIKRLDNLLRSSLYAHFSESLSGLATIRAYGEDEKFLKKNEALLDIENRAYYLTVINQRWLGIRLDFFGGILTVVVALIGVGARFTISPAQTGLILSYILTIQAAFTWMVRQAAEVENDMNSVERLLHYAHELEQEAPAIIAETQPPASWPSFGALEFKSIVMSYRAGLPPVLKGLTLNIGAGEKVGVVGRTGAGKSSIMMALFRIVELDQGSITVDGVDIAKIGLSALREKIAIIPQDALLFNGTIRSNLDPFNTHEDIELWSALKRAYLVDQSSELTDAKAGNSSPGASRFNLDLVIEDEGLNLSVGERSLVSLARALVKDSRIVVLDEATASVDYQTDSRIQETIRKEFKDKTLLCIAHRLRTIINYDRVLVMDNGQVAEFDTPLNLFRAGGIFHGMCLRSNLTEADILQTEF